VAVFCEHGNEPLGFHKERLLLFDKLTISFPKNIVHNGVSK
jgi:hypothetical protein